MQNYCASYGKMRAIAWFKDGAAWDNEYTVYSWTHGGKERKKYATKNVDAVGCCIESEICHRQQVEANSEGKIWFNNGSTYISKDVSTHKKRYALCEEHPKSVYCKNDPKGDAFTKPVEWACGDDPCTVSDCQTNFENSDAYEGCQGSSRSPVAPTYSIATTDETNKIQNCTVTASCWYEVISWSKAKPEREDLWSYNYQDKTVDVEVSEVEDLVLCVPPPPSQAGSELVVGSC